MSKIPANKYKSHVYLYKQEAIAYEHRTYYNDNDRKTDHCLQRGIKKMQKKAKKRFKILGIILLVIVLVLAAAAAGIYFYLRNRFGGGTPQVNLVSSDQVITVTGGQLKGGTEDGVYSFLGVPYAKAGERFTAPEEVSWEGVFEATSYGAVSPQQSIFGSSDDQDNDCLNLNIWTNGLADGAKRPVMVWYHGGGMTSGSANEAQTNGKNLAAREDVVVVTVNHRLGALAYLDLSEYSDKYKDSGNVGVLDMVASLQWIHDNIEAFGGDPDNVTIFGQSGGGAKVLALMTTPYAKGLFHKAINESGATDTLGPVFATEEMAARVSELVLSKLNISAGDIEKIQSVPFEDLNSAGSEALQQVADEFQIPSPFGGSYAFEWMPYVDGDIIPTNPVLDEGFAASGKDIPLLIGSNLNEWNFSLSGGSSQDEALNEAFKNAYPDVDISNAGLVDTMLRAPLLKITAHKADQGGAPVYSYIMTYGAPQAVHGAEISLIFGNTTTENETMAKIMGGIWAQFARTGDPTTDDTPQWEPYTREGGDAMILDLKPYLAYHHDEALLDLLKPGYEY